MFEDAMGGILLKVSIGSAGADVRRLDAGTSSFPGSVRLLGHLAISRTSEALRFEMYKYAKMTTDRSYTWYYFELMGPWRAPGYSVFLIYSDSGKGFSGNDQAVYVGVCCCGSHVLFGNKPIERRIRG